MNGWAQRPLAELLSEPLRNGRSVPTADDGFPVLRLTAIKRGSIDLGERKTGAWTADDAQACLVAAGDFMIARGNGSLALVGRGGLVRTEPDQVAFPDTMIRARPDPSRLVAEYLALVWESQGVRRQIERSARTSAGIYKVSQPSLAAVTLPVPSVVEQRRIVAILEEHLSDLDAGLSYVDSAAARLVHLRRAELDRIFGPGVGPTLPLGDLIADISAGKSFGSAERPAAPDEWGIIKVSAMTWGEFRPDENKAVSADRVDPRFEIRAGDLLVSRANTSDYVGASVLVPAGVRPKLLLCDKSLRVLPRPDINPEWLWRALQAPGARRQMSVLATGTKESMRNISQESLKRVVVPVVNGSEQGKSSAEFAEIESAIRRQLGILASLRSRAGGLRCAVLAAAFSGRLTGRGSDTNVIEKLAEEESA